MGRFCIAERIPGLILGLIRKATTVSQSLLALGRPRASTAQRKWTCPGFSRAAPLVHHSTEADVSGV